MKVSYAVVVARYDIQSLAVLVFNPQLRHSRTNGNKLGGDRMVRGRNYRDIEWLE